MLMILPPPLRFMTGWAACEHKKAPVRVRVEDGMPFGRAIGFRRLSDRRPGIVDEDVEPAEPVGRAINQRPTGRLVGNVERNERGSACEFGHCHLGFPGIPRGDDNPGPGRDEPFRHAEPDPAIATGHDRDAPG